MAGPSCLSKAAATGRRTRGAGAVLAGAGVWLFVTGPRGIQHERYDVSSLETLAMRAPTLSRSVVLTGALLGGCGTQPLTTDVPEGPPAITSGLPKRDFCTCHGRQPDCAPLSAACRWPGPQSSPPASDHHPRGKRAA
jgi:hypothetical protein